MYLYIIYINIIYIYEYMILYIIAKSQYRRMVSIALNLRGHWGLRLSKNSRSLKRLLCNYHYVLYNIFFNSCKENFKITIDNYLVKINK